MQERLSYPPKGFQREEIEYHGPKGTSAVLFVGPRTESVWLIHGNQRHPLITPPLNPDALYYTEGIALGSNRSFVVGSRKLGSGMRDVYLWVRQTNGTYRRLSETVNGWIKRRHGLPKGRKELSFIRVIEWRAGGNGVVLACQFDYDKRAPWQRIEIDLVRGKFSAFTRLPQDWTSIL